MYRCRVKGLTIGGGAPVRLMGVINCSPESFFSASYSPAGSIHSRACTLVEQGADIIDIGARSTAPHAPSLPAGEERLRMKRALSSLEGSGIRVSVDTMDRSVLEACLTYDIALVNDISGLLDPGYASLVESSGLPSLLMASIRAPGDPLSLEDVHLALSMVETRAHAAGVTEYILDPGIGLWREERTTELDWEICRHFRDFSAFNRPLLAAVSRKTFLGTIGNRPPEGRLPASLAMAMFLVCQGADIVRTHDVAETRDVIAVAEKLRRRA
ncbi:MAG: dihydropteroate synthase [Methanolinea sp.]|nr:dihydropteroate synthase [Methanolinea sp.]